MNDDLIHKHGQYVILEMRIRRWHIRGITSFDVPEYYRTVDARNMVWMYLRDNDPTFNEFSND